jgi:hypothetical protein
VHKPPKPLAELGVSFSYLDGSALICGYALGLSSKSRQAAQNDRNDAEEKLMYNEAAVSEYIVANRRERNVALDRIHWESSEPSRLLCNKQQKRCLLSFKPLEVVAAAKGDFAAYLKDLPVVISKQKIETPLPRDL